MPELPEVETVRRGLVPLVGGGRILGVEMARKDLRFAFPPDLAGIAGTRIETIGRRAKYLLFMLSDGRVLLSHLGMTGAWRVEGTALAEPTRIHGNGRATGHDHLVLSFERDGQRARLVYNDPRRFGFVALAAGPDAAPELSGLGPEPLGNGFSSEHLAAACAGRAAPIKSVLLDQRNVAGLGNIYVCEALWRAGIAPTAAAGTLAPPRLATLVAEIREVLTEAIAAGGSTLRDFVGAEGSPGYFQHSFDVYGRAGEACRRPACTGTVARLVQSGRSSFFCPDCQSK
ncbi:MAG: bifunctional DNA-formamidopyrimidine glycosylase/DNA-(apurinic or apyrimidinic site) lyase [Alphaproteobacteria bacterium]|nr:bifunctional DNA-formamidopyrimidine glycosylase/DNA-(apurinic or apyrimidinic site) lyase [Alphaproteobacteria bacterium]